MHMTASRSIRLSADTSACCCMCMCACMANLTRETF